MNPFFKAEVIHPFLLPQFTPQTISETNLPWVTFLKRKERIQPFKRNSKIIPIESFTISDIPVFFRLFFSNFCIPLHPFENKTFPNQYIEVEKFHSFYRGRASAHNCIQIFLGKEIFVHKRIQICFVARKIVYECLRSPEFPLLKQEKSQEKELVSLNSAAAKIQTGELTGKIESITFPKNGKFTKPIEWTVLKVKTKQERVACVGNVIPCKRGDKFAFSGTWEQSKYGKQFRIQSAVRIENTESGAKAYMEFLFGAGKMKRILENQGNYPKVA